MKAKSTALTVKYLAKLGSREQSTTDTFHLFWVKDKWTWTLDDNRVAACTAA